MRGHELRQVLLTLGVAFVLNDVALVIWGGDSFTVPIPDSLRGAYASLGCSIRNIACSCSPPAS